MNRNQKGVIEFVLILAIAFVALALIGFNLYKSGRILTYPPFNSFQPTPTINFDEVANWKSYTNQNYKFEIKYPSMWVYKEILPNTADNTYTWPPLNIHFAPEPIQPGIVWITIDTSELTLDEYIDDQLCDAPGVCASSKNATDIQISGYSAKKVSDMPGPLSTENILVKRGDTIYRITISYEDKSYDELYTQDQKREIFNQILSTFEFIDAETIPGAKNEKIEPEVYEAFKTKQRVSVIVDLKNTPLESTNTNDLDALKKEVEEVQDKVLADLDPSEYSITYKYEGLSVLALQVTESALEKLNLNPLVEGVGISIRLKVDDNFGPIE